MTGSLVQDVGGAITAMLAVGPRMWAGLADGQIRIVEPGNVMVQFRAHSNKIMSIVHCGARVYTLAEAGAIKGWASDLPSPHDAEST